MPGGRPPAPESLVPQQEVVAVGQMVNSIGDVVHAEMVRAISAEPGDPLPAMRWMAKNGLLANTHLPYSSTVVQIESLRFN